MKKTTFCSRGVTRSSSSGFTIVELMIVVVVIAILAVITIVGYNGIQNRARDASILSDAQQAGKKITTQALLNDEILPASAAVVGLTDAGERTYQYTQNTTVTPNTYCVTATNGDISAHVAGATHSVKTAVLGPCPGHTGTSPTTAASGDCPTGYIVAPGSSLYDTNAFCVMQYEAKNSGGSAVSTASDAPWTSASQAVAITAANAACSDCHLITDNEWLTIAQNIMHVASNWSGGSVGSGCLSRGNNGSTTTCSYNGINAESGTGRDAKASHILSNSEVIWDLAGNMEEWTRGITTGGQPGSAINAFREWNALVNPGTLSPNPYPTYANPSATGWTGPTQGIGQAYTNSALTDLRAFRRGGGSISGNGAGVFALALNSGPTTTSVYYGFRVAR